MVNYQGSGETQIYGCLLILVLKCAPFLWGRRPPPASAVGTAGAMPQLWSGRAYFSLIIQFYVLFNTLSPLGKPRPVVDFGWRLYS